MTSTEQQQTEETFSFKWKLQDTYASDSVREEWQRWLLEKYFDGDGNGPARLLGQGRRLRILDAGCGAGVSALLLFGDLLRDHDYIGVDISDAVRVAEDNFSDAGIPGTFVQADITNLPDELGQFDIIFSEGVLHHTDSVEATLAHLATRLVSGGHFLLYVYSKQAPVREFTDDHIRDAIRDLPDEQAWEALLPLTQLGKALGDLNIRITVPEDIPYLGIEKGEHDLQRLFIYKICKAYYQPDYTLDEMNHINFDWFRPLNCHRHTPNEFADFCAHAGLAIERIDVGESGITVIARRGHTPIPDNA